MLLSIKAKGFIFTTLICAMKLLYPYVQVSQKIYLSRRTTDHFPKIRLTNLKYQSLHPSYQHLIPYNSPVSIVDRETMY